MRREEWIQEGDQLRRIRGELGPLERLLARKKDELFARWSTDEEVSREFCKGALSVIDGLMHDIDALIESANVLKQQEDEEERQEKELSAVSRTPGLDGGGYGDLAS